MTRRLRLAGLASVALLALSLTQLPSKPDHVNVPSRLAAANGSWTVYHRDDAHTGYDNSLSTLTSVNTGWVSTSLDANVYAEPLIYNGLVYAASLNNTVYALNQSTGAVVWSTHLRAPKTSGWVCGNVAPMGILGTPVIDAAAGRIYAATLGSDSLYRLEALNLATGAPILATVITNTSPALNPAFDWTIQQERGALGLGNGYVYVPFGGRDGDCGQYHGWVFAVPTDGSQVTHWFKTGGTGIGIWAAGGVTVDDATGNVYVASGNGVGNGGPDGCAADTSGNPLYHNDAVEKLSPTLAELDFFMPQDWQNNWCGNDQDLGSAGPTLLSSSLWFEAGKWGGGFIGRTSSLGGVNGQAFPVPNPYSQAEVCFGNHSAATYASFAYAAPFVYVECEGQGLVALNVNTGVPSFSPCDAACAAPNWHVGGPTTFGPAIVAGGAVWVANDGGGLYAFNATTGAPIYHSAGFNVKRFVTPAEAGGQVFVPSLNVIRSFDMSFVPWLSLGGVIQGNPVVVSGGASQLDLFIRGSDNALWHKSWNGTSWGAWEDLGGVLSADPSAVALSSTQLDVFIRGQEGGLWHRTASSGTWGAWEGLGGVLSGGPTSVGVGSGRLDVFIRGSDNGLWQRTWTGAWGGWQSLGGVLTATPNAGSAGGSRIDLFHRGTDNALWQRTWNPTGGWGPFSSLGGYLPADPVALIDTTGQIDIFARGSDNVIWQDTWNGSSWSNWTPRGGSMTYAPAVSSCAAAHLDVFHVGTDFAIWQLGFNGSSWGSFQKLGGEWTSAPVAICTTGSTSYFLLARGAAGDVWVTSLPAS